MLSLIVGLGNPGDKYKLTRHNIGFLSIDALAARLGLEFREQFSGLCADFIANGRKCYLLKPLTFMNLSGESVGALARYYKIERANIAVIHDDLDFPFARLKLRNAGSDGGHNGLKSIIAQLGGQDFKRFRMGVGGLPRSELREYMATYVLANFTADEQAKLPDYTSRCADAVMCALNEGFDVAMNKFNTAMSLVP
ncbi:aminoacyl-tRNA hydrolase [Deferribacterales bacterium RsTz2092]|nr:peptidyl-tRNA hydrolase [Deferribacterales bacterium]